MNTAQINGNVAADINNVDYIQLINVGPGRENNQDVVYFLSVLHTEGEETTPVTPKIVAFPA